MSTVEIEQSKQKYSGGSCLLIVGALFLGYVASYYIILCSYGTKSPRGYVRLFVENNPVGVILVVLSLTILPVVLGITVVGVFRVFRRQEGRTIQLRKLFVMTTAAFLIVVGPIFGLFIKCDACDRSCFRWDAVKWELPLPDGISYSGAATDTGIIVCPRCYKRLKRVTEP